MKVEWTPEAFFAHQVAWKFVHWFKSY